MVPEADDSIDDLVFVSKSIASELTLPVFVSVSPESATRGTIIIAEDNVFKPNSS